MSGAAEERRSRGCLEESRHMLPSVSRSSSLVFSRPPRHLTHGPTHPHPGGPALALCNLFGSEVSAQCTFPCILPPSLSSSALLPLCLFMLLLLLLPDIFRDELQSTAGGKKAEGEQFGQRASRFLLPHFLFPTCPRLPPDLSICLSVTFSHLLSSPLSDLRLTLFFL